MQRHHHLRLLTVLCAVAACTSPVPHNQSDAGGAISSMPPRALTALGTEQSWSGDLPCADCSAVETTITLAPDGTYRRQGVYRGTKGGGDTILTEIGRWTHDGRGAQLTLRGSAQQPGHFAVDEYGALHLLDVQGQRFDAPLNYRLLAVRNPVLITHPARLVAAFQYFADAASAVECGSGLLFPVDMSAAYPTLEARYRESGTRAGEPLVVRLRAHLAPRPGMEGTDTVTALVIDSVMASHRDDGCAALRMQDAIAGHGWRLVSLQGTAGALPLPADTRATFTWDRTTGRFVGHSGCNRYSAVGAMRGTTLAAGPAVGTKMACLAPEANAVESRLLALLNAFPSLRVDSDTLVFTEGPADVARFVRE